MIACSSHQNYIPPTQTSWNNLTTRYPPYTPDETFVYLHHSIFVSLYSDFIVYPFRFFDNYVM